ncbi:MAG: hypothetical protein GY842_11240 [bacterium]|nr:hypothetical protein [bacterium]
MAKKKKARKTSSARSKKNREVLVVASKVKAYIKDQGMNTSGEAISSISERVYSMLDEATARTVANGRKTLKAQDI